MTWSVVVSSSDTLLLVTHGTEQRIGTGSGPVDRGGDGDDSGGDSAAPGRPQRPSPVRR
jgi:hypothetical protein